MDTKRELVRATQSIAFLLLLLLSLVGAFKTMPPWANRVTSRYLKHDVTATLKMSIPEITSVEEFESAVSSNKGSNKAAIMLFKKLNCRPCQKIAPQLTELIEKYKDKIDIYEIQADASKECLGILKKEGIRTVPTFQFYKAGEKIDHVQGARLDEVEEMINNVVP